MTQKDYVRFAFLFRAELTLHRSNPTVTQALTNLKGSFADILAHDDPKFDRQKFYWACESGVITGWRHFHKIITQIQVLKQLTTKLISSNQHKFEPNYECATECALCTLRMAHEIHSK